MTLFYILSFVILLSSILLITYKNPVYSVLNLVLLFVSGSVLVLVLGIDFLPFVFIIVYVGAVAVLFLFVVIILDIKISYSHIRLKEISYFFLIVVLVFTYLSLNISYTENNYNNIIYFDYDKYSNLSSLGYVLYTSYVFHFVLCGLILLVALVGAIVLTSRRKSYSNKQRVFRQCQRSHSIGKNKL